MINLILWLEINIRNLTFVLAMIVRFGYSCLLQQVAEKLTCSRDQFIALFTRQINVHNSLEVQCSASSLFLSLSTKSCCTGLLTCSQLQCPPCHATLEVTLGLRGGVQLNKLVSLSPSIYFLLFSWLVVEFHCYPLSQAIQLWKSPVTSGIVWGRAYAHQVGSGVQLAMLIPVTFCELVTVLCLD